jgi:hypothetical protein
MKLNSFCNFFILVIFILFCNCSKQDETEPAGELIYHSLVSEKDTIAPGEQTKITATATGTNLSYFWKAEGGTIINSGYQVNYTAGPCDLGKNKITCEIKSSGNLTESKSLYIVVYEF